MSTTKTEAPKGHIVKDAEAVAISRIATILGGLSPNQRWRVVLYFQSRELEAQPAKVASRPGEVFVQPHTDKS